MRKNLLEIATLPLALFFAFSFSPRLAALLPNYTPYDRKRIFELILLALTALSLLLWPHLRRVWLERLDALGPTPRRLLAALLLLGITSSLLAPLPRMALLELGMAMLLFIMILQLAALRVEYGAAFDRVLLLVLLLGILLYQGTFIASLISHRVSGRFNAFHPLFVNSRFLSQYLTWTLPLVTLPLLTGLVKPDGLGRLIRAAIWLLASFWWTIALVNGSRGTLIGLALGMLAAAWLFRHQARSWLISQAVALGLGLTLFLLIFGPDQAFSLTTPIESSVVSRLALIEQAWQLIQRHPLLGVGPLHFAYYHNLYAAHPHNSLLQIASEWGPAAAIILLLLALLGVRAWLAGTRSSRPQSSPVTVALTAALVAGAFHSLVSGVIVMPTSQVMLAVVIGWMVGLHQARIPATISRQPRKPLLKILPILLPALAFTLFGALPDALQQPQAIRDWLTNGYFNPDYPHYCPRIWYQGWLR